jgi:hypothetical protein
MSDIKSLLDILEEYSVEDEGLVEAQDSFDIELGEDLLIETGVVDITEDGILVEGDEETLALLEQHGVTLEDTDWSKYDKPTHMRIKSGETEPVDRTDYNVPPAMRDKDIGKPGYEKRRSRIMKGLEKVSEADVEESGLQAYLGNKKYGKAGMDALRKAGREGASKEKMAQLRAKYDKLDEKMTMGLPGDQGSKVMGEGLEMSELGQAVLRLMNPRDKQKFRPDQVDRAVDVVVDQEGYDVDPRDSSKVADIARKVISMLAATSGPTIHEGEMDEAKYQGREVPLGKPMAGDVKKSKVYVRKPNGKVVKVNFGDKKMRIKKSNPKRRKSFRARHNCKNPGPRWKARYWSCRAW